MILQTSRYCSTCETLQIPPFPITSEKVCIHLHRASPSSFGVVLRQLIPPSRYPLPISSPSNRITKQIFESWLKSFTYAQTQTRYIWEEFLTRAGDPMIPLTDEPEMKYLQLELEDEKYIRPEAPVFSDEPQPLRTPPPFDRSVVIIISDDEEEEDDDVVILPSKQSVLAPDNNSDDDAIVL